MATARMSKAATTKRASNQPAPGREAPRTRHLRAVPDVRRRALPLRISPRAGVVLTVSLFGALFGVAVSHAILIEGQMELEQLDERAAEEQARYERLRRDVAELESPDRIVREAREELGMVPAEEVVWLTPDQPAPDAGGGADGAGDAGDEAPETPATSWADIKPYLGSTP
ncbi:MAG TPA: septum formation initiator family protein [Acidimicrobiales bacterium]